MEEALLRMEVEVVMHIMQLGVVDPTQVLLLAIQEREILISLWQVGSQHGISNLLDLH